MCLFVCMSARLGFVAFNQRFRSISIVVTGVAENGGCSAAVLGIKRFFRKLSYCPIVILIRTHSNPLLPVSDPSRVCSPANFAPSVALKWFDRGRVRAQEGL